MIFYVVPLIVIIVCLAVIGSIVIKKMPSLAAIKVETIAKEKEKGVRNRIMTERLARRYQTVHDFLKRLLKPAGKNVTDYFEKIYQQVMELEKKIQPQPLKVIDVKAAIADKLKEAEGFLNNQEYEKAEEVCISIVELDPRQPEVYEILADVYLALKDYKEARETRRYLLKLLAKSAKESEGSAEKHRLANAYAELGWVYELENRHNHALENYQKAVALEPSNPRFLDLLLKISIILKNKKLASQTFNSLREADPDNQKLGDLREQIKNIV